MLLLNLSYEDGVGWDLLYPGYPLTQTQTPRKSVKIKILSYLVCSLVGPFVSPPQCPVKIDLGVWVIGLVPVVVTLLTTRGVAAAILLGGVAAVTFLAVVTLLSAWVGLKPALAGVRVGVPLSLPLLFLLSPRRASRLGDIRRFV